MENIITTSQLTKSFGKIKAVNEVSMNIPKGSIYGLVGKNGAGKTTLLRMFAGLVIPTAGGYSLFGVENTNKEVLKMRKRMGTIIEKPSLYENKTVIYNLKQQRVLMGVLSKDCVSNVIKMTGLEGFETRKVKNLSLGQKQRVAIAMALIGNPDLIILDEPFNGLDPMGIVSIRELLVKLNREQQVTVVITSHYLDELSKLVTHLGFIDTGRIVKEVSVAELEMNYKKYVMLEVNDTKLLTIALNEAGIEYEILSDNSAKVFSDVTATHLFNLLSANGCEVISMTKQEESLENYFINLVGGVLNG